MAKFTGHTITNDSALGDAKIQRSLRFNDADSTYLRKSDFGSPDSGTTFTFSAWVKRTELGTWTTIAGSHSGTNAFSVFGINSNDRLIWRLRNSSSSDVTRIQSENLLRDTNAWYHLVLERNSTLSTAGDRAKLYINGVRVTEFDQNTTDSQNDTYRSDFLQDINIGRFQVSSSQVYYGGMYLAEYHYVDGQALDPSYFGFTDPVTDAWMPKRYEGTHGTNGFYLDFSDNSSTTALGIDKSVNGNDFTPNNFSISPGVGNDSVIDTPTNNFCTLNPLYLTGSGGTIDNGNLDFTGDSNYSTRAGTFSLKTGKWYWECTPTSTPSGAAPQILGIVRGTDRPNGNSYISYDTHSNIYGIGYSNGGNIKGAVPDGSVSGANIATGQTTFTLDDIIGLASDIENGTLSFYKNGTLIYTVTGIGSHDWFAAQTTYGTGSKNSANFGQRPFSYTPPAGYKSLCSKNLSPITPSIVRPQKYFDTLLYTGNQTAGHRISGLEFKPDLVWIKQRNGTRQHQMTDVVRGVGKVLVPSEQDAEQTISGVSAFNSDGFTLGDHVGANENGDTFAAWCWKAGGAAVTNNDGSITSSVSANQKAGFSIVSYTGNGSAGGGGTIGHGLGKIPNIMFVKNLADASNWSINGNAGGRLIYGTNKLYLHSGSGLLSDTNEVTAATATTFTVTTSGATNGQNDGHIAYCWTEIPGFSKFDVYTGNGSTNGAYVHLGFRPACLIFFNTTTQTSHTIFDNRRSPVNLVDEHLFPSSNNAEASGQNEIDFLSFGFKHRSADNKVNSGNKKYLYMAWAEQPGTTPFDAFPSAR